MQSFDLDVKDPMMLTGNKMVDGGFSGDISEIIKFEPNSLNDTA